MTDPEVKKSELTREERLALRIGEFSPYYREDTRPQLSMWLCYPILYGIYWLASWIGIDIPASVFVVGLLVVPFIFYMFVGPRLGWSYRTGGDLAAVERRRINASCARTRRGDFALLRPRRSTLPSSPPGLRQRQRPSSADDA
jgi:hypothetical protein